MAGYRTETRSRGPAPSDGDVGRVAELFGLLSDQARARILYALLEAGELSVDDLTIWTGVSAPRTSDALRVLRSARVVNSRRAGDATMYKLRGDHVRKLLEVAATSAANRRLWQMRGLDPTSPLV